MWKLNPLNETQLQIYKDKIQQLDSKQINEMFVLRFSWIFRWAEKITNGFPFLEQKFDAIKFFQKKVRKSR